VNAENRYYALQGERDLYKQRAYQYATWTLPNKFLDRATMGIMGEVQQDYQSIGARGLINLAGKIMLTLFHPSRPFFKLSIDNKEREKLLKEFKSADIDLGLSRVEKLSLEKLNTGNLREKLEEALILLPMIGDAVLYMDEEGKAAVYNLHEYVRELDTKGDLNYLVIREPILRHNLPENIQRMLREKNAESESSQDFLFMFTQIARIKGTDRYSVTQEISGLGKVNDIDGEYGKDTLPWINLYWSRTGKENYGRGRVEEMSGAFAQLSNVSQTIAELTALLADIKGLVNPEGHTSAADFNAAESGEYLSGREGDVTWVTPDIKVQLDALEIQYEIGAAFLVQSAMTRDSERTTAEEIRMNYNELETINVGFYSAMSVALQEPIAKRLVKIVDPGLQKLKIKVLTGLESLSRFNEVQSWKQLVADLSEMNNVPQQVLMWMKMGELIKIIAAGYGLEYEKVLKTQDEYEKDVQMQMQQEQDHNAALEQGKAQAQEQGG
jgi:hypothetical protein